MIGWADDKDSDTAQRAVDLFERLYFELRSLNLPNGNDYLRRNTPTVKIKTIDWTTQQPYPGGERLSTASKADRSANRAPN
ncbi:hypothetical protein HYPDE_29618 [Hyphomicrobium denitrificans 1NES1]|uniref:Uncharacterized protein n=1 Tax=Hyphomicrobium denitrificans 1NES1 TaxID=670307 RepID=N0B3P4_9HYPH|nr:hypothetical protein HYPDE_29618 [Hyphomicrobium denitrificans 1NES1]